VKTFEDKFRDVNYIENTCFYKYVSEQVQNVDAEFCPKDKQIQQYDPDPTRSKREFALEKWAIQKHNEIQALVLKLICSCKAASEVFDTRNGLPHRHLIGFFFAGLDTLKTNHTDILPWKECNVPAKSYTKVDLGDMQIGAPRPRRGAAGAYVYIGGIHPISLSDHIGDDSLIVHTFGVADKAWSPSIRWIEERDILNTLCLSFSVRQSDKLKEFLATIDKKMINLGVKHAPQWWGNSNTAAMVESKYIHGLHGLSRSLFRLQIVLSRCRIEMIENDSRVRATKEDLQKARKVSLGPIKLRKIWVSHATFGYTAEATYVCILERRGDH
jgi:hypothetical protein